jgi:hypothetical protein
LGPIVNFTLDRSLAPCFTIIIVFFISMEK